MADLPLGRPLLRDRFASLATALFDFLLPPVCPACGRRLIQEEYGLCADCLERVEVPSRPLCSFCGRPRPKNQKDGRCDSCKFLPDDGFDAARAAFLYAGPIIDVIHHMKYHRCEELSECLGRWMFRFWRENWPETAEVDAIVPVPLHPWRLWHRGFNQSESLARVVARFGEIDVAARCLRRVRRTRSQTRMTPRQRFRNVADAFQVSYAPAVEGRRILLVDDVMTTGATLSAAAKALHAAGAETVWGLTVARAM